MKTVILASTNKIKIEVAETALKSVFKEPYTVIAVDIELDGAEPVGEEATLAQISASIEKIKTSNSGATFYIVMEGGVRETAQGMEEVALVRVEDAEGHVSLSRSVSFPIPNSVAEKVRAGVDFATAVDQVFETKGTKTGQGFVGLLTDGIVDKKALYLQPTVIALSKFAKKEWFW